MRLKNVIFDYGKKQITLFLWSERGFNQSWAHDSWHCDNDNVSPVCVSFPEVKTELHSAILRIKNA